MSGASQEPYDKGRGSRKRQHRRSKNNQGGHDGTPKDTVIPKRTEKAISGVNHNQLIDPAQKNYEIKVCILMTAVRNPSSQSITSGEGRHDHRDQTSPHIDRITKVGSVEAKAQKLKPHNDPAGERSRHQPHRGSSSVGGQDQSIIRWSVGGEAFGCHEGPPQKTSIIYEAGYYL